MEEREAGMERLRKEVALVRAGRVGRRIIWPATIRDLIFNLASLGVSVVEISKATGILSATIRAWQKRCEGNQTVSADFRELGISGLWDTGVCVRGRDRHAQWI